MKSLYESDLSKEGGGGRETRLKDLTIVETMIYARNTPIFSHAYTSLVAFGWLLKSWSAIAHLLGALSPVSVDIQVSGISSFQKKSPSCMLPFPATHDSP